MSGDKLKIKPIAQYESDSGVIVGYAVISMIYLLVGFCIRWAFWG